MNRYLIGILFICIGISCIPFSIEQKKIYVHVPVHFEPQIREQYKLSITNPYLLILGFCLFLFGFFIIIFEYKKD